MDTTLNDHDVEASRHENRQDSDYIALNSLLNFYDANGKIQFDKDREAARQYFLNHVNSNTQYFHSLEEKLDFLTENEYYETEFLAQYPMDFIKALFKKAYAVKFRFPTFVGAYKFYNQYAMKTFDGKRYLERYEDRISIVALYLARGDQELAEKLMYDMVEGRYQPATPTFLNSGKKQRGDLVSCFPAGTQITVENGVTKNIEDLKIGDRVLTHTGSLKRITKTIINPNSEVMVTLKPANSPAVTMTGNHPVLIYTEGEDDRETIITSEIPGDGYKWVAARDVRVNEDYVLLVGQDRTRHADPVYMETYIDKLPKRNSSTHGSSFTKENYVVHEGMVKYKLRDKKHARKNGNEFSLRTSPVKNEIALDYDFGKFLGYYLAEGYASSRHNDNTFNSIIFTFGAKEDNFIQDVVEITQRIFGVTPKVNKNLNDNSARISVNSVLIAEMINDLVGTGYNKKVLNDTLFNACDEFVRGLFVGAFRGDGCTYESRMIMDLVNPVLIRQLRTLAINIGLVPGIRDYTNQAGNHTTSLFLNAVNPSNHDMIYEIGKNLHRFIEPKAPIRDFTFSISENEVLSLVVGKDESEPIDTVYNLEVEDDHTYLAEGVVVHNCFLIDIQDNMESISRAHNAALQLSKRGGGVALNLSNIREEGAPIKKIEGQSSGVIPVMKMLEDAFSYANQLGQRQGSGAVYLHAHHPDIMKFLDTRRENADEKIRIKTLSLGIVVADITLKLAAENKDMYLFSPYDVEREYGKPFVEVSITENYDDMVNNPNITKKKMKARRFFQELAEVQFESGYPYLLFEDNANKGNPLPGRITMSNLCQTGDVRINTNIGYKRLDELYRTQEEFKVNVDNRARDFDLTHRDVSLEDSTRVFKTAENAEIFKLQTKEGYSTRGTAWHKYYVVRDGKIVKLPLAELVIGDELLIQPAEGSGGSYHDPDLAYLAGVIAADGTMLERSENHSSAFIPLYGEKQYFENDILEALKRTLERHSGLIPNSSRNRTPAFVEGNDEDVLRLYSAGLAHILNAHNVNSNNNSNIPEFVFDGNTETRQAYVRGLLQMDGGIGGARGVANWSFSMTSINPQLLKDLQILLLDLGISSQIYDVPASGKTRVQFDSEGNEVIWRSKPAQRLNINRKQSLEKMASFVKFKPSHQEKIERAKSFETGRKLPEYSYTVTVTSIEFDGIEDVYDVTVENGNSLIFNGISTGNCSEILQTNEPSTYNADLSYSHVGRDISCNLGSINIARIMESGDFGETIENSMRSLIAVSDMTDMESVPSIKRGNNEMHSVGLGAMNLHGYLAKERIHYGSREGLDFTNMYFYTVNYHSLRAAMLVSKERGETFTGFEESEYASGVYFDKYTEKEWAPKTEKVAEIFKRNGVHIPTQDEWKQLKDDVQKYGVYTAWRIAIAPTGSISYVASATQSILPQSGGIVESRKEGKMGRVYYPAPYATNDNVEFYKTAYDVGYKAIIDTYAVATQHIDQGASLTLHLSADEASTRTLNQAQIYAWKRGIKTLYYTRINIGAMEGTDIEGCVSCSI